SAPSRLHFCFFPLLSSSFSILLTKLLLSCASHTVIQLFLLILGYAVPPPSAQPNYSSTYTIIQQPATTTSVVVVGGCPACRVGVLEDTFTCLGVLCAIVFFPIGILFCLALRQRRCPNCGAAFG
uniref:Membrane protein BRI3 n=1 Tax=Dromaius novaehollandiae TaxID=8790 RepID=A0A8C4JRE9_DRONO